MSDFDWVRKAAAKDKSFGQDYKAPALKTPTGKVAPVKKADAPKSKGKTSPKKVPPQKKPVPIATYTDMPNPPLQLFPLWVKQTSPATSKVFRVAQYDTSFRKQVFAAQGNVELQQVLIKEAAQKFEQNLGKPPVNDGLRSKYRSWLFPTLSPEDICRMIEAKLPVKEGEELETQAVIERLLDRTVDYAQDKALFGSVAKQMRKLNYSERKEEKKSYWSLKS